MNNELKNMSSDALLTLAAKATALAKDLKAVQPSYALALACGILDRSYDTVRWGVIPSFSGECDITMADGSRWRAIGHGPEGCADYVSRDGYVEFIPLD